MARPPLTWLKQRSEELLAQPRDLLTLRLTLLLMLLHGSSTWTLDLPLRALCGLMLLSEKLLVDRWLWILVCALTLWINALNWAWIDNHKFLIAYWSLACAIAVSSRDREGVLAHNARYLIGFAFLFAILWKFIGGQFLDGSFLHFTAMTDDRLELPARLLGGLEPHILPQNRLLETALTEFPENANGVLLHTSDRLRWATLLGSYWTLLIEGSVAVTFLAKSGSRLAGFRDTCLIAFILTTYGLLPVAGFAFGLCVMGFAQCDIPARRSRLAYFLLFIIVQFIRLPWAKLVQNL